MSITSMKDVDLKGKYVLIRQDLNVPIRDGKITSDIRIQASLPTVKEAMERGAKVMLMSHLGRPTEGKFEEEFSLNIVADHISGALGIDVPLVKEWRDGITMEDGEVVLLENVRFNEGEKKDTEELSKAYASLCDVFVMDAFGTAHRAQASTHGVAKFAPIACAGPLLTAELNALELALAEPARPLVAIVGGAKVSSKLTVLESLSKIADVLVVGGGISNTFVAAQGHEVGKSLYEKDLIPTAKALCEKTKVEFATDVRTTTQGFSEWNDSSPVEEKSASEVGPDDSIIDCGPETEKRLAEILKSAKTIIWNGPTGVFEIEPFSKGTEVMAKAIAESDAFSIAGGGDTLAAIDKFGLADKISYISTGGGAFLEYVEGKELPAVEVLKQRSTD